MSAGLRDNQQELVSFRRRLGVVAAVILICFGLLIARFAWLQIVNYESYHAKAEDNRISVVPTPPNRGVIVDRNGVVLARNYSAYTLEITPSRLAAGQLDPTIDALARIIDIQPHHRRRFKQLLEETRTVGSLPIRNRLTDEEVARFAAWRFMFPAVEIKARLFREYPLGAVGGHVLGYIGRISAKDAERIEDWDNADDYKGTEYIGKVGIEQSYERELHGSTGFAEVEVSAGGKPVRTLSQTPATPGNNLVLSVDIRLQQMVEQLYGARRGALVAIEPSSGDVLAFVSRPGYDPNLFVDGIDPVNWKTLNEDPDKPLLNRPLRGVYPPGSTFKPFMALAALESGKRTPGWSFHDTGVFNFGGRQFRDSKPGGNGVVDLHKAIVYSSDTYFYMLANDMGIDAIASFMKPFGFGQLTGIDIEGEKKGVLPSSEWKRSAFKRREAQQWYAGETISVGIGQGYNSYTILQLAHAVSTLANNGVVMKPHVVREVVDARTGQHRPTVPEMSYTIPLKPENIEAVKSGMVDVNRFGTGSTAFAGAPYVAAGKTGTAQVIGIKQGAKYNEALTPERFRDHSLFIAFAPADNPKIAVALIVENGGFGAKAAGPIARRVFDYWLLGKWPEELDDPRKAAALIGSDDDPAQGPSDEERGLPLPAAPDLQRDQVRDDLAAPPPVAPRRPAPAADPGAAVPAPAPDTAAPAGTSAPAAGAAAPAGHPAPANPPGTPSHRDAPDAAPAPVVQRKEETP
ncbi:penicillin-binding protein 2 [Derxia lacustris]|uniref:penicillin-binding protein 2 n=1 Tax=Derxia lacustris TaxID=764842 RepID=UPI000A17313B|nr:penicillin-binding protein 2 [Derxia lacustris]